MFIVGITASCEVLGCFSTQRKAAEFISQLPDHEEGIYYIDGPCDMWLTPKGFLMTPPGEYRTTHTATGGSEKWQVTSKSLANS